MTEASDLKVSDHVQRKRGPAWKGRILEIQEGKALVDWFNAKTWTSQGWRRTYRTRVNLDSLVRCDWGKASREEPR
jgi:hypothetical protein